MKQTDEYKFKSIRLIFGFSFRIIKTTNKSEVNTHKSLVEICIIQVLWYVKCIGYYNKYVLRQYGKYKYFYCLTLILCKATVSVRRTLSYRTYTYTCL